MKMSEEYKQLIREISKLHYPEKKYLLDCLLAEGFFEWLKEHMNNIEK